MANDVAIRAVRWIPDGFGEFDCQRPDLSIHLELVTGWRETAQVRGKDTVVPSMTGQVSRNRVKHQRDLELYGVVQGDADVDFDSYMASYDMLVKEIQEAFDPTLTGTLELDLRDGTTWSIVARPMAPLVWGEEEVPGVSQLSIALVSVVPDWTSA